MKREVTRLAFTRSTYLSETYEPGRLSLAKINLVSIIKMYVFCCQLAME